MTRARLLIVTTLLACGPRAATEPPPAAGKVAQAVRDVGEAWGRRDVATLDRLLAETYIHTDVSGAVLGRAAWLAQVQARGTTVDIGLDDLEVTPVGDAAIATGRNRVVMGGRPIDLRFTQLWIQEKGVWRRRSFQATIVPSPSGGTDVIEAEIRAASAAWADAIQRRDVKACDAILGAEYALMAPGIGVMPRAKWLASLPEYTVHSYRFDDIEIQVHGETAVMRSRYTQSATVFGVDRSGEMLVTDVWVKRDGRWQVVARHTSFL